VNVRSTNMALLTEGGREVNVRSTNMALLTEGGSRGERPVYKHGPPRGGLFQDAFANSASVSASE